MVGFDKARLLRANLPKEVLCSICLQVLKNPINCKKCELFFCQSCTELSCNHHHKYTHEYMEPNKFILNKLNELSIKCSFFQHGCNFTSKLSDIEKHEDGCSFKQEVSDLSEETKSNFSKIFRDCPVSKIQCELACKFNVKSPEKEKEEKAEWLKSVVVEFDSNQAKLTETNKNLQTQLNSQKVQHVNKESHLSTALEEAQTKNKELQKQMDDIKIANEKKIAALKDEVGIPMKIFHENSKTRVKFYQDKNIEEFKTFNKNIIGNIESFFDNFQQNIDVLNKQLEHKIDEMLIKDGPLKVQNRIEQKESMKA